MQEVRTCGLLRCGFLVRLEFETDSAVVLFRIEPSLNREPSKYRIGLALNTADIIVLTCRSPCSLSLPRNRDTNRPRSSIHRAPQ